jgi:hypothetical protein
MSNKTIHALRLIWTGTPSGTLPAGAYAVTGGLEIRLSEDDIYNYPF